MFKKVGEQVGRILEFCRQPRTRREILKFTGFSHVYLNYKRHVYPLIAKGLLELTIPDKPNSRLQKYRITEKGVLLLRSDR